MRIGVVAIVLAGVLAYAGGLKTPFMFDDENSVVSNQTIRTLWPLSVPLSPPADTPVAARPLPNLTLAIDYAVHGANVVGYHVVNLAIHLTAALLLFVVVRWSLERGTDRGKGEGHERGDGRSGRGEGHERGKGEGHERGQREGREKKGGRKRSSGAAAVVVVDVEPFARGLSRHATMLAGAAAILWVVHPLTSEVVQYISQRTESLMACAYLATLLFAIVAVHAPRRGRWEMAAVAACAAGMACKESMVTAPVMVLLYDRAFLFPSWRAAWRRRSRLYLGLAATWLLLAALIMSGGRTSAGFSAGTSPWVYLLNQAEVVTHYLRLVVWPRDLVLDYGLPRALALGDVAGRAALLAALVVATGAAFVRWPRAAFAGVWFFLTLAPTSSIVPIATEVGAERRMYLPLMAIAAAAVVLVYRLAWTVMGGQRARAAMAPAIVAAAVGIGMAIPLAYATVARTHEYESRMSIARTIVERRPNGRGHFLLAYELMNAGQEDAAIVQLRLSAKDYVPGHYGLGVELANVGQSAEAIAELQEFIRLMPTNPAVIPARELLGRLLIEAGRMDAAAEQFTLILQQVPMHARARQYLNAIRARRPPN
jgi:tetratricopeptide (TPR) repeat protein